ncbi:hypothetical protein HOLleu_30847 [Holothuria leucospilota]|uniref:Uncharacterized protein n=1 Tax=Holothuria leucospilota TaxID=206669 RepID=A0A9Q1BKY4_HOLLE|nr:hypothetical protein HOLleu_30847 [Holothuria leucospilota]
MEAKQSLSYKVDRLDQVASRFQPNMVSDKANVRTICSRLTNPGVPPVRDTSSLNGISMSGARPAEPARRIPAARFARDERRSGVGSRSVRKTEASPRPRRIPPSDANPSPPRTGRKILPLGPSLLADREITPHSSDLSRSIGGHGGKTPLELGTTGPRLRSEDSKRPASVQSPTPETSTGPGKETPAPAPASATAAPTDTPSTAATVSQQASGDTLLGEAFASDSKGQQDFEGF